MQNRSCFNRSTFLFGAGILWSLLLSGCEAEDLYSTRYPCRFIFNTQLHSTSKICTALTSYDEFVYVTVSASNGIYQVKATDRKNQTETTKLTTAKETYAYSSGIYLGANNGFILGLTNFNGPVAWDRQCPNCIDTYGNTDFPLSWSDTNVFEVKCAKCGRSYSLETGAITSGGKGEALMRYRVSYGGTGTLLTVGN